MFDSSAAAFVKIAESDSGDAHAVAGFVGEDGLPENIDAIASVDEVELFGKSADKDDAPEAGYRRWSLFMATEPFKHGDTAGFVYIGRMTAGIEDGIKGASDSDFVFESERRKREKAASHVKGRGEQTGAHFAAAALRIEEEHAVEEFYFVAGADAAVEILEVGAAAEGDVLAIVDVLAIRQDIGSRASAKERALLKESNAPACFS